MSTATEQRVFISYRRSDCQSQANGLHDGLRNRLPSARIFMDIDSIPPGADFEEHIRSEIEQCQTVLVLIGDNWLDRRPGTRVRRIDEPNDFVRLEVESALSAPSVRVIPVLVEGAGMPGPEDLPESIRRLARLNAIELADSRWTGDVDRLTEYLKQLGGAAAPASAPQATYASPQIPAQPQVASYPAPSSRPNFTPAAPVTPSVSNSRWARYRRSRWFMGTIPIVSVGIVAWLPPVMVASARKSDRDFQRKMYLAAGAIGVLVLLAFILIGSAPTDATGSPTGPMSGIGTGLDLVAMASGAFIGFKYRDGAADLAGAQEHLARRELRQEYRQLVARDRSLAASMMVGRPDLRRDYDDGGLLDLNSLTAEALQRYGSLTADEARQVVELRAQLGRIVDVNEIVAYLSIPESTITRLRETAVFI